MNSDYGTKIFLTDDIRRVDQLTLSIEKITEEELITRAAGALFGVITQLYPPRRSLLIFCGPGNNGNDGRAVASMLVRAGYEVEIFDLRSDESKPLPTTSEATLIIDALFGSGLSRPLEGTAATWVKWINRAPGIRIAIDIPSGFHGDENRSVENLTAIQAHHTLTLAFPKLSLLFPESEVYAGAWQVVPFGLSPKAVDAVETPYRMICPDRLRTLLKPLPRFLHKSAAGRVRLLAGSVGMMGAVALAVKATYRMGAGWVEALVPQTEVQLLQMMVPETIVRNVSQTVVAIDDSTVFGAGPGLGTSDAAVTYLQACLAVQRRPCVLDADALNILAMCPDLWAVVPQNSIITPHAGEFRRLVGGWENDFERLQLQRRFAAQHKVIVVLKGAFTSIALPDGMVYFNPSGNPGMATAGSGDVLTGMVLGLLAQGLPPQESAILSVYLHGCAGDLAAETLGERSVMASDIVENIGAACKKENRGQ